MAKFSKQIQNFLKEVGAHPDLHVQSVPKTDSCAVPGDVVFFRYKLGTGVGSRKARLLLVTLPITRVAGTGNLLLTGFKLPEDGNYTPESLETLYKNGNLPLDNFRTYIMSNIFGHLRRIRK